MAGFFEESAEGVEFVPGHVGEEGAHGFVDVGLDAVEEGEAFLGDGDPDDAFVAGVAGAFDEGLGFEPIDEAGDVGHADDHFASDLGGAGALGFGSGVAASEDAEDVVGGGGESWGEGSEVGGFGAGEFGGGAHEVEVGLFFGACEG